MMNFVDVFKICAMWAIVYGVIKFIVWEIGVDDNDNMGSIERKINQLDKRVMSIVAFVNIHNKISNKEVIDLLKQVIQRYIKVDKLFNVYLFDNPDNKTMVAIRKRLSNVEVVCRDLILELTRLDEVETNMRKDLEDKMLQLDILCKDLCKALNAIEEEYLLKNKI